MKHEKRIGFIDIMSVMAFLSFNHLLVPSNSCEFDVHKNDNLSDGFLFSL